MRQISVERLIAAAYALACIPCARETMLAVTAEGLAIRVRAWERRTDRVFTVTLVVTWELALDDGRPDLLLLEIAEVRRTVAEALRIAGDEPQRINSRPGRGWADTHRG